MDVQHSLPKPPDPPPDEPAKRHKRPTLTVMPRLYSVPQAAVYLGLSRFEVYDMLNDGTLPHVRRGRRKLIDIKDLDKFIDDHKE